MKRNSQIQLLKKEQTSYGGDLLKTRKGRAGPRPLDTKYTMHLNLRSSKAVGQRSFRTPANEKKIAEIVGRFSKKYSIKIHSMANVGNHLHFQIKLANRFTYKPFIRAITAAIAMAITGASRWKPLKKQPSDHFWDRRPFTRVVQSFKGFLNLRDYIEINQLEGLGANRSEARMIIADARVRPWKYRSD
jgi:REP element-mobilizing transposase RayT